MFRRWIKSLLLCGLLLWTVGCFEPVDYKGMPCETKDDCGGEDDSQCIAEIASCCYEFDKECCSGTTEKCIDNPRYRNP